MNRTFKIFAYSLLLLVLSCIAKNKEPDGVISDKKERVLALKEKNNEGEKELGNEKEIVKENELSNEEEITQYCGYENVSESLGIGLLVWNYDCSKKISLYEDQKLSLKFDDFNFCDETYGICPLFYKPDYGIMHFAVIEVVEDVYKIIYNKVDSKYLSKDSPFKYYTWADFFESDKISAIRIKKENKLYKIESFKDDFLIVTDVDGQTPHKIKWRDSNNLLIDIMLLN
ncbi:hypothetical protein [Flagellimonas sp. 2504JD1-5]